MCSRRQGHTLFHSLGGRVVSVVLFVAVVVGCSIAGSDPESESAERTLPEALDVRRVSLEEARHSAETPDTVNVAVHVIELAICPETANCFLPDGIVIAEHPNSDRDDARRITVGNPRQFTKEKRYLISMGISDPSGRTLDENLLDLIGYSRLK